jgi:hypothetical protein
MRRARGSSGAVGMQDGIPEAEDAYTRFNSAGPVNQFLSIVVALHDAGYKGFSIHEPDTWPVRDGWADALERMLDSPEGEGWWMRGGIWRMWRPTADHINGNALYRLQDNGFYIFLYQALRSFRFHNEGFDFAINELRGRIHRSWPDYQWLMSKFSVVPFLVNIPFVCATLDQVFETISRVSVCSHEINKESRLLKFFPKRN